METSLLTRAEFESMIVRDLPVTIVERDDFGGLAVMATNPTQSADVKAALQVRADKWSLRFRAGCVVSKLNGFAR
jgi:hypothetical protein